MPRRVLISVLIFLTGAGALTAGTLNPGQKTIRFQPGQALQAAVLRPAQVKAAAGEIRFGGVMGQRIIPLGQMPARMELGRTTLRAPCEAKVSPAAQPAAANH